MIDFAAGAVTFSFCGAPYLTPFDSPSLRFFFFCFFFFFFFFLKAYRNDKLIDFF
jgi:hypothetical protein